MERITIRFTIYLICIFASFLAACNDAANTGGDAQKESSPLQTEADSVADLMYGHYDASEFAECIEYGPQLIELYEKLEDSVSVSDVYGTMGVSYMRIGNMADAMKMTQQALHIDSLIGDPELLSSDFNNLAGIYLADGQVNRAKIFIDRAIDYERQTPDSASLSNRYGIASEIYARAGEGKKAMAFAHRGLDIARERADSVQMGKRLSQLGDACISAECYDEALSAYHECDVLLTDAMEHKGGNGPMISVAINLKQLGKASEKLKRTAEAIDYYERSTTLARKLDYKFLLAQTTQALGELYAKSQPDKAVELLIESRALADTLHNQHEEELATRFAAQYDLKDKEYTIERQADSLRAHRIALVVGGIVVLLIAAAFGLYVYLQRLRRRHELLSERYSELVVGESFRAPQPQMECATQSCAPLSMTVRSKEDDAFVAQLAEYVEKHLSDTALSVTQLADEFCVSPRQFARRMKDLMGIDTTHYIRAARVMRARHLLTTTDLPMQEVAYQCGFESSNYFSRVFRQAVGQSPTEYRKSDGAEERID